LFYNIISEYGIRKVRADRWWREALERKTSLGHADVKLLNKNMNTIKENFVIILHVKRMDRLCGLVVTVPRYIMEMYCVSCEVRTEFIYVM
jgi:hypothetical protein